MGKTQEQIDKMHTLIGQNGELIKINTELTNTLNAFVPTSEVQNGINLIIAAINARGGNATSEDGLTTLAQKIKQLQLISLDTTFDDSVPTPINASYLVSMHGKGIVKAYDENVESIGECAFLDAYTLEYASFPNAKTVGKYAFDCGNADNYSRLKVLNLLNIQSITGSILGLYHVYDLIDLIIGKGF